MDKLLARFLLVLCCVLRSDLSLAQTDSSYARLLQPFAQLTEEHISIEAATFPIIGSEIGSWMPDRAFRIGYGRLYAGPFDLRVFFEYAEFKFNQHSGLFYRDFSDGLRRDYALYSSIVCFGLVDVAIGAYYTKQDEVYHTSIFSSQVVVDPPVNQFKTYYTAGLTRTVRLWGPIGVPVELLWQKLDQSQGAIGLRAGLLVGW